MHSTSWHLGLDDIVVPTVCHRRHCSGPAGMGSWSSFRGDRRWGHKANVKPAVCSLMTLTGVDILISVLITWFQLQYWPCSWNDSKQQHFCWETWILFWCFVWVVQKPFSNAVYTPAEIILHPCLWKVAKFSFCSLCCDTKVLLLQVFGFHLGSKGLGPFFGGSLWREI